MSDFTSCDDCIRDDSFCNDCRYSKGSFFKPKPKQKIIDLSMMVGSDIDCEFTATEIDFQGWGAKLKQIHENGLYVTNNGAVYTNCRIRENHWHFWAGGTECPLPEGLEYEYRIRGRRDFNFKSTDPYTGKWEWSSTNQHDDIIAFKVLGTADDACYEWQIKKRLIE